MIGGGPWGGAAAVTPSEDATLSLRSAEVGPVARSDKNTGYFSNMAPAAHEGHAPRAAGTVNVARGGVDVQRPAGYERCGGDVYPTKRVAPAHIAKIPSGSHEAVAPRVARDELLSWRGPPGAWERQGREVSEAASARAAMPAFSARTGAHGLQSEMSSRCEDEYV